MLTFCSYLRGFEENETNFTHKRSASYKNFIFYQIPRILALFFPGWITAASIVFVFLLVDVVALEFLVYQVGLLGGQFYKSLTQKSLDSFKQLAFYAISLIIINALMVSLRDFFAQLLSIIWRKNVTLKLHNLYFKNKNFYYIQQHLLSLSDSNEFASQRSTTVLIEPANSASSQLDNPDQRITQDVFSLSKSFSTILPVLLISPFVIAWYTYQAWLSVGYFGPVTVFVYFLIWSVVNGPLTSPIARVIYKQDKKEGDFRFRHMNLRTNAESIAFYDSTQIELTNINSVFSSLLSN